MNRSKKYRSLVKSLMEKYGTRLKTVVLFGSQARHEAKPDSDYDVFVVVDGLPFDPLTRQKDIRSVLLPILTDIPGTISFVAKTPAEVEYKLTPLMLDICVDGVILYGDLFFDQYRQKALAALHQAPLKRRHLEGTWMWVFPHFQLDHWDLNWDGYHADLSREINLA